MSVFHSVPGVPRGKMERFGGLPGVSEPQKIANITPLPQAFPFSLSRKENKTYKLLLINPLHCFLMIHL